MIDTSSLRRLATLGLALAPAFLAASCQLSGRSSAPAAPGNSVPAWEPDLPVSSAPFDQAQVDWKERLAQPYVFLEHRGSYTEVGRKLEEVAAALAELDLAPSGPPFCLFYDDPGRTPIDALRARACFPVAAPPAETGALQSDVLPSGTVVYAFAGGAYPEVPRIYPALYAYLERFRWVENGPIREIYLVNPAAVASYGELVCEVQLPAGMGPR